MGQPQYVVRWFGRTVTSHPQAALLQIIICSATIVLIPVDYALRAIGRRGLMSRPTVYDPLVVNFKGSLGRR